MNLFCFMPSSTPPRKSYMEIGEIYFWTATIHQWKLLLWTEEYKNVILRSLEYLSNTGKISVYAFVIMPNHIHMIWKTLALNGKETAQGSFLKYTAHEFRKQVLRDGKLPEYRVQAANKKHEFWKRDSLAFHLYTRKVARQKLRYLHRNPIAKRWRLANCESAYQFSSASFYEEGEQRYLFLKNLWEEL